MATIELQNESATDMEALYQRRLRRYVTALRNGKPDMVPIRPFVAEITGVHAGYTCQELAHDYQRAFAAARKCAADFDWDAVVSNMVYVWTGLTQAIGLKYYGIPGLDVPANRASSIASRQQTTPSCVPTNTTVDRGPQWFSVQRVAAPGGRAGAGAGRAGNHGSTIFRSSREAWR